MACPAAARPPGSDRLSRRGPNTTCAMFHRPPRGPTAQRRERPRGWPAGLMPGAPGLGGSRSRQVTPPATWSPAALVGQGPLHVERLLWLPRWPPPTTGSSGGPEAGREAEGERAELRPVALRRAGRAAGAGLVVAALHRDTEMVGVAVADHELRPGTHRWMRGPCPVQPMVISSAIAATAVGSRRDPSSTVVIAAPHCCRPRRPAP